MKPTIPSTKTNVKLAVNLKTGQIYRSEDGQSHAHAIGSAKAYDNCVRLIYWPARARGVVYVRFYKPDGDLYFISEEDKQASFDAADKALSILYSAGHVARAAKVFYWHADERRVKSQEVKL